MSLDKLFKKILDDYHIDYTVLELTQPVHVDQNLTISDIPLQYIVKDALLKSGEDLWLAIYPANRVFELEKMRRLMGRDLRLAGEQLVDAILNRYRGQKLPPLNASPGLHLLMDEELSNADTIFYRAADLNQGFIISMDDFHGLVSDEKIGISFTTMDQDVSETITRAPAMSLAERMKRLRELPPLPETTSKLLALRDRYEVNADYLISIIEVDPVLTAQIVGYANSAFFGQNGKVNSLKDAIFRVLGVNTVVDMALGLSFGKVLHIPHDGPLGAYRLWRHSTYSAALTQKLATLMPWGKRPDIGTAYLAGLLHDIGFFVLAYLFKEEHRSLSRLIEAHPEAPITQVERNLMGVTHCELGQMAMRYWNMPDELVVSVRYHHNDDYEGEHAVYVLLLNLVERLLSPQGLSNTPSPEVSERLFAKLGLEEEAVILAVDEVIQAGTELDSLAMHMAAA